MIVPSAANAVAPGVRLRKEFRTDYFDAVLIHRTPGLKQMSFARAMEVHSVLVRLRC
jgi:hypothetical protein